MRELVVPAQAVEPKVLPLLVGVGGEVGDHRYVHHLQKKRKKDLDPNTRKIESGSDMIKLKPNIFLCKHC